MKAKLRAAIAVVLCAMCAAVQAQLTAGGTAQGHSLRIERDSASGRVAATIYEGLFSYVRIEQREPGSVQSEHPFQITPAALRDLLGQVHLGANKAEPLFSRAQLEEIAEPLAAALARATPEQDISLAASDRFGLLGAFAQRAVTTARVFRKGGKLHLITGLVRREFESQFRGSGVLIAFEPGKRASPVDRAVQLGTSSPHVVERGDWIALDPSKIASMPLSESQQPGIGAQAPAPGASPNARGADELYRIASERLRALQRLHAEGLISDAEYKETRMQILRDM